MPNVPANARVTPLKEVTDAARKTGFLGRVSQAVRYVIAGITPATWMSPEQPYQASEPDTAGRQFDYPVGANLFYTPRGTELTSFQQLRALADNCDIVRLAIETRKDQLAACAWSVGNVQPDKDAPDDPATKAVLEALRKPDGLHSWQAWLRMLLEELLVIDAPTIYHRQTRGGAHYAFELLDGSTIKPLIDAGGRSPLPPSPAYQQVLKGLPTVDYTRDELMYLPRNPRVHKFYGYSPVEQILLTVNIALRRAVSQLQYFTEGSVPAAFATVPPGWTPQQIAQFQEYWDTVVEGQQARHRQVRFAPDGSKVTLMREAPLQDVFDEWLARIVCFAFSIPPTPFIKQMNRATAQQQNETGLAEGLTPFKIWVKEVVDHLIQVKLGQPQLEFRWMDATPVDPAEQATILCGYQKQGNYSVNDIRAKLGEEPINEDWANAYVIITATGATPLADLIQQSHIAVQNALAPPEPAPGAVGPRNPDAAQDPAADGVAKPGKTPTATSADDTAEKAARVTVPDDEPLDAHGASMLSALTQALAVCGESAARSLTAAEKAADGGKGAKSTARATATAAAANVDLSGLTLAFDDVENALVAIASNGARHTVAQLVQGEPEIATELRSAGIDWLNHEDPNAIAWAKGRAADLISSAGDGGMLTTATRDMIRTTITQGLEAHQTLAEIAETLQNAYAFSEARAEFIARTEVRNAREQGALQGALRTKMQQKQWLLSNDEGVCPLCSANAAQGYIPIDKPFSSGNMAPLAHPRCRCVATYRRKPKEG